MIETSPRHRAPHGVVLGIAIMAVFYLGLWMTVRALFPSPALHCHRSAAVSSAKSAMCKPVDRSCVCPPR